MIEDGPKLVLRTDSVGSEKTQESHKLRDQDNEIVAHLRIEEVNDFPDEKHAEDPKVEMMEQFIKRQWENKK